MAGAMRLVGAPVEDVQAPVTDQGNTIDVTTTVAARWQPTFLCWSRATTAAVTLQLYVIYDSVEHLWFEETGVTDKYRTITEADLPALPPGAEIKFKTTGGVATENFILIYKLI